MPDAVKTDGSWYLLERDVDGIELNPGRGHEGRGSVLTAAVIGVATLVAGPGHFQAQRYVAEAIGRLELERG